MNVKPSSMPTVAAGLAVAVLIVGVVLWFMPSSGNDAATAGGTAKAVKVDKALAAKGEKLSQSNGCTSCHSIDGSAGAGPSWAGLWGTKGVTLGKPVDTAYVVAILKTPPPVMSNFQGKFSPAESEEIAEYIKSLANAKQ
jgi:cytochrome c oxidase subunit 2